jgi:hypothetical protein
MAIKPRGEIPEPEISDKLISGLYSPNYLPEDLDLTNFIEEVEVQESVPEVTIAYEQKTTSTNQRLPVTQREAQEIQRQTEITLKRISTMRQKIATIQNKIDDRVGSQSGDKDEFAMTLNISKKPRIKRAIKHIFGYKTNVVTFSMYKEMLKAKASLEEEEAQGYLDGSWDE